MRQECLLHLRYCAVGSSLWFVSRREDSILRYVHDLRDSQPMQQLQLGDDDEGVTGPAPTLDVQCRALPVATLGKGIGQPFKVLWLR